MTKSHRIGLKLWHLPQNFRPKVGLIVTIFLLILGVIHIITNLFTQIYENGLNSEISESIFVTDQ